MKRAKPKDLSPQLQLARVRGQPTARPTLRQHPHRSAYGAHGFAEPFGGQARGGLRRPAGKEHPLRRILFRTVRPCHGTAKSHVSHVAEHSRWEHTVAFYLENSPEVISYVKNDHLDFVIPYELYGVRHNYLPDYLVRLRRNGGSELNLILEVKGFESEADRQKHTTAERWVRAVNHHGGFGTWQFVVCREPHRISDFLK